MFDLRDESKWKPMSGEAIKSVCSPGTTSSVLPFPPLCASTIDPAVTSNEIELQLRILVSEHRKVIPFKDCHQSVAVIKVHVFPVYLFWIALSLPCVFHQLLQKCGT